MRDNEMTSEDRGKRKQINLKIRPEDKQQIQEYAVKLNESSARLMIEGAKFYAKWRLKNMNKALE